MKDVHINTQGDIELGFDGDLAVVYDDDVLIDQVLFRLKTYKGDWELEPDCGASLEDAVGQPNTPDLGADVELWIEDALTHDGFLNPEDIYIRVSPLNYETLLILVQVKGKYENVTITSSLDLKSGLISVA